MQIVLNDVRAGSMDRKSGESFTMDQSNDVVVLQLTNDFGLGLFYASTAVVPHHLTEHRQRQDGQANANIVR